MEDTARALIIVDVQPTFCEGGALAVDGGNATAERIADFVTDNADEYSLIVTTQDWHINPGTHFSEAPDFVDTWPPHGVAGTREAELHEAIASLPIDVSVKKGEYAAAYSGFEGHDSAGQGLEDILRAADIKTVDVVGIAESHCVKETALDSLRAGFTTRVFSDLTVPVTEELGELARQEMDEAGVEQTESSEAFGFYEEGEDAEIPADTDGDLDPDDGLDLEDDYDDDADADEDSDEAADLADADYDFDDFDLDEDGKVDFSEEVDDDDFDFSDIDFDPTQG